MTMRFGRMKSSIAEPSRRNSGLLATLNGVGCACFSWMVRADHRPGPMGTVLLVTTTL